MCTALVPFGTNLSSTVGYPQYTVILQHMVTFPPYIQGVVVGLLLSDAWIQKTNKGGQARLGFKQSINAIDYLLAVFFILSHYCSSLPILGFAKLKGKVFPFLSFTTRSLAC